MKSNFVNTNNINLHYLEFEGEKPTLLLMHGLTANAHAFDGLIKAGLSPAFHVISVDLRGRGESEQPATGYTMAAHAKDIIGLLETLQLNKIIMMGHSFGGFLALYIAKFYPDKVDKIILLDAAARMHPKTTEMLGPSMQRLGKTFPSFENYLQKIKSAPYLTFWDDAMLSYYKADVKENANGTVTCIPQPEAIMECITKGSLGEPWTDYLPTIQQETLLINAPGIYTMNAPLLPEENAMETVNMLPNCIYTKVSGNHQTMLYGEGAKEIVDTVKHFLKK